MSNRIQQAWLGLEAKAIPPDAGQVQRKEMRRAFFCGAKAMLAETIEASDLPELLAMRVMSELNAELEQFLQDLTEGKA